MEQLIEYLNIPLVKYGVIPIIFIIVAEIINRTKNSWVEYNSNPIFDPDGVGKANEAYDNGGISQRRRAFRFGVALIVFVYLAAVFQ